MSFIQPSTFLSSTRLHASSTTASSVTSAAKEQHGPPSLRSNSSLATLVQLVRNPLEAVVEWRGLDGTGQEERARRQRLEDRKQILYLRLRNVSTSGGKCKNPLLTVMASLCRLRSTMIGKLQLPSLMKLKTTMPGNRSAIPQITMRLSLKHVSSN